LQGISEQVLSETCEVYLQLRVLSHYRCNSIAAATRAPLKREEWDIFVMNIDGRDQRRIAMSPNELLIGRLPTSSLPNLKMLSIAAQGVNETHRRTGFGLSNVTRPTLLPIRENDAGLFNRQYERPDCLRSRS